MNEKWFALSLSEIEKKLKTNAAAGLSRKAARSRWTASAGTVFSVPVRSPLTYLGDIVGDFAFIMLMIMSFLALCFDESDTGIITTTVIAVNLVVAFAAYYRSEFFCDSLERSFLPGCRVIRDGKLFFVDGTHVVRGDVIMLEEGDVLPCDARLITSDKLKVKMLVEKDKYVLLDKAAEGRVAENENDIKKYDNIVHAGSVVVNGSARAVVTEIGRYTYVGARLGTIPCISKGRRKAPAILSLFKKYCTAFGMMILLIVLPFSVICMLFGNATLSLFTSFMTAIAVAASSMAQFAVTVYKVFFTIPMRRCISAKNPATVRSCDAMDRLAAASCLLVLDGASLSDGMLHFDRACCAEGEVFVREGDVLYSSVKKLGELASLYEGAGKSSLSVSSQSFDRYDKGICEFVVKSGTDRKALDIRCSVAGFAAANSNDPHDKLFYTDMGDRYMLCVSYTDSIINECSEIYVDGKNERLSSNGRLTFMNRFKRYTNEGKKVLVFTVCRHEGYAVLGTRCLVGMIVLSEHADASAPSSIAYLEKNGLKTIFFRNITVDGRRAEVSAVPEGVVSGVCATPLDFAKAEKPLSYGLGKIRCYDSFSDDQVCEIISELRRKGEKIAVIGFCEKYTKIYAAADLCITCSSDKYSVRGSFEQEIDVLQSSDDPSKDRVAQVLRQNADVIIPRHDGKKGGGFLSLIGTHRASRAAYTNTAEFFRYVICMQIVRMILVMVPMLFGSSALDARHVLLGGMIADIFAMLSFATERVPSDDPLAYKSISHEFSSPIRSNAPALICFSFGALFASLLPEIISLFPASPRYIDKTEYSLIIFVLFHITVFGCMRYERIRRNGKKALRGITVAYPVILLVLLVLCFVIPALARRFDIEGFSSLLYLFVALIPPVVTELLYFLLAKNKMISSAIDNFIGKWFKDKKREEGK